MANEPHAPSPHLLVQAAFLSELRAVLEKHRVHVFRRKEYGQDDCWYQYDLVSPDFTVSVDEIAETEQ